MMCVCEIMGWTPETVSCRLIALMIPLVTVVVLSRGYSALFVIPSSSVIDAFVLGYVFLYNINCVHKGILFGSSSIY